MARLTPRLIRRLALGVCLAFAASTALATARRLAKERRLQELNAEIAQLKDEHEADVAQVVADAAAEAGPRESQVIA